MAVVHASDPQLQPAPPPPPPEPATEEAAGLIGLNALLPGPLDHPANELGMFHMTQKPMSQPVGGGARQLYWSH
jgi:hypothetical protein